MNLPFGIEEKNKEPFRKGMNVANLAKLSTQQLDEVLRKGLEDGELSIKFEHVRTTENPEVVWWRNAPIEHFGRDREKFDALKMLEKFIQPIDMSLTLMNRMLGETGWEKYNWHELIWNGQVEYRSFIPCNIPAVYVVDLIQTIGKFWDNFSHYDDHDLSALVERISALYSKDDTLDLLSCVTELVCKSRMFKSTFMRPYINNIITLYRDKTWEELSKIHPCTWSIKHYTSGGGGREMFYYHYDTTIVVEGRTMEYKYRC